jgi:predicted RNA-binding protein (virulence factor B family)
MKNTSNISAGQYHLLKVKRSTDFGFYLDDGGEGILLPTRLASLVGNNIPSPPSSR